MDWVSRREVLTKLLHKPFIKSSDEVANTFYQSNINNSAGLFAQFDWQLYQAMVIPTTLSNSLDQNYRLTDTLLAQLNNHDKDIVSISAVSTSFLDERLGLLEQIQAAMNDRTAIVAEITLQRQALLNACATFNNGLTALTIYEQNQKFLNGLSLKKAQNVDYTEEDYAALRVIAAQCPQIAGYTINKAKNLLPAGDPLSYFPEDPAPNACEGLRPSERSNIMGVGVWDISPNPANDLLIVHFAEALEGVLSLSDVSGKTMHRQTINTLGEPINISLSNIVSGLYFLTVQTNTGLRDVKRIVIQH